MKSWGKVWTFAQKCLRLPILVIPFVILRVNVDIYNKSMIVQFIFVYTFKQNLNDACTNKGIWTESQMDLFSTRVPDGSFFRRTRTNYQDLCINQMSATNIKGCIDRTRHRWMLFLAWVLDGSLQKLKPNKLINLLISQEMLPGII